MTAYSDANGKYLGVYVGAEPPSGAIARPSAPTDARAVWTDGAWVIPAKSAADLDALAQEVAQNYLEDDMRTKALGLVLADVIERAFGVSQSVARQQVKSRFEAYYRGLLD